MKKLLLLQFLFISIISNAQYFEGFENGFPGSMTQNFLTGTTSWSDCGGDTGGAICPINGSSSATFYLGSTATAITSLNTPTMDLSNGSYRLSFNHIQRNRSGKKNLLYAELSQNGGTSWTSVGNFFAEIINTKLEKINLPTGLSTTCQIRFRASNKYGYAIVLDDILIEPIQNNDAELATVNLLPVVTAGNVTIAGTLKNTGLAAITTLDINWQVDGGATYTQSLSGLNIIVNQVYNYSHATTWAATQGQHQVKTWVSNTNGGDQNANNNEIIKTVYVVNEVYPRTVVYEEATGSWCQFCPRGHVGLKDMSHYYNSQQFIGIAVHNNDPMRVIAYDNAISAFISGYPSGATNRTLSDVDSGYSAILASYQSEKLKTPLAKIGIADAFWNPTNRSITFSTTAKFACDINTANYNMAAVVVENNVVGTTSGYNQVNAYSGGTSLVDWEGIDWSTLPNPVLAANMVYEHVGRALLGGFAGVANSVPTSVVYNTDYNYAFSHTLPTTQNINNISLVALLIDNANGQIVNAGLFDLGLKVLATDTFEVNNQFNIYPNPTTGIFKIATNQPVNIAVVDVLGKTVFTANDISNDNNIDLSAMQKGIYFINITSNNIKSTQKLILN